jgi:hypothetical protein
VTPEGVALYRLATLEREVKRLRGELEYTKPEWDATDAAHPCWWRGHDNGSNGMLERVNKILDQLGADFAVLEDTKPDRTVAFILEEVRSKLPKRRPP